MRVTLVIPIYNEAQHLERFLAQVDSLELPCHKELIFIDDASTDDSLKILKSFKFSSSFNILEQGSNQGKGSAIRRGIAAAKEGIVAVQDADFEYDMNDLKTLIIPVLENRADVVYGSRFSRNSPQVHRTFHYLVNRFLTALSNILSGMYLSDMETCYKIFRSEIIQNIHLKSNRFGFEPEVTAKLARLKIRVLEYPINYYPRNYLEGKKISWKDGVAAIWHLVQFNLLTKKEAMFSQGMPETYRIKHMQWL